MNALVEVEHSQMDVNRCEEMTAKSIKVPAPLKNGLVHVKREPVDNSKEIRAGSSVALQNGMSWIPRKVEKMEKMEMMMHHSTPEHPSGVSTHASQKFYDRSSFGSQMRSRAQESQAETEIKNRNSNPGRRIQGGRIYDSSLGKTCHWCRQKTVEHHVKCRECTIHYCGPCLLNRNGENIMEELAEGVRWLCPKCRNGCGPGCDNCCNCGPCRKAGGKAPTGQLVREARNAGFLNVHDYLVHLETDETPEEVAKRKVGRDWTNCGRFEWSDSEESDESSSSEGGSEFTLNEETSSQLHEGKIGMKVLKKFVKSQKRKRGVMRGALPATWSQVEASPSVGRRNVDSIVARVKVSQEFNLRQTQNAVEAASRRAEQKRKEASAPKVIQRDSAPRVIQRDSAPKVIQRDSAPKVIQRDLAPKAIQRDLAPKVIQRDLAPRVSQRDLAPRGIQRDLALGNQFSGMKTCKREYVEVDAGNNVGGSDVQNEVEAASRRVEDSAPKVIQGDLALGNQYRGLRTCKREYVEVDAGNTVGGSDVQNAASRRAEQKRKEDSTFIQRDLAPRGDLALGNQQSGMRPCKREYVEVDAGNTVGGSDVDDVAVAKRRKVEGYSGEEHHALVCELRPPRSPLLGMKCKVEPITLSEHYPTVVGVHNSNEAGPERKFTSDADKPGGQARPSKDSGSESELTSSMGRASVFSGVQTGLNSLMFEQRSLECPSDPQGTEYRMKLKSALAQPFDAKELEMLEESAKCRKPVQKLRQMRGRIVDVVTEGEGFSYLDHHQDFASELEVAQSAPLKLALLRGFFFWLQHSCMEGAFMPWPGALTGSRPQSGDCIETEGPDCQVTAVVLQLDEGKDALQSDEGKLDPIQLDVGKGPLQLDEEKDALQLDLGKDPLQLDERKLDPLRLDEGKDAFLLNEGKPDPLQLDVGKGALQLYEGKLDPLQLDEGKAALQLDKSYEAHRCVKREITEMVQRPLANTNGVCEPDTTSNLLNFITSRQALIPFPVKKNPVQQVKLPKMKGQVTEHPGTNYRVVLSLPAPALLKK